MNNATFVTIFYIFAAITVFSAAFVVFSKNVIYSAFALLFTFFGAAALYVFLSADFIAVAADESWLWIYRDCRAPGGWFLQGLFS